MSGANGGGVLSSRLVRFFVFIIIACAALLTYQVWVLTKRCGMYENRMLSYDAQLHRLEQEKSSTDKRANSYRQQAIHLKDVEGKLTRESADLRRELEDLRRQMSEVKVSENKAQQALETTKNALNERNDFLSKRETTCRSDISQLMRDLESCKSKLTPYQIDNTDLRHSKPLQFIQFMKNDSAGSQVSHEEKEVISSGRNNSLGTVILSSPDNTMPEEKERAIRAQLQGGNELLIQKLGQNDQPIKEQTTVQYDPRIQQQRPGQNVQPVQQQQPGQNVQSIQLQQPGQNVQPVQQQQPGQNGQPTQGKQSGQNVQPIQQQQPGQNGQPIQEKQPGQNVQPNKEQRTGQNDPSEQAQRPGLNSLSIQQQQQDLKVGQQQPQGQGQPIFGGNQQSQGNKIGQDQQRSDTQNLLRN